MARWFIFTGLILVLIGMVLHFAPALLAWFGKLPGDIRIESEHTKVFIPLTSMVVVSIILTILINLVALLIGLVNR